MGLLEPDYADRIYVFTDTTGRFYVQHDNAQGHAREAKDIVNLLLKAAQMMAASYGMVIGQPPPAPPNGSPRPEAAPVSHGDH